MSAPDAPNRPELPPVYAVYNRPKDYPNELVARAWYGEEPGSIVARAPDLMALRAQLLERTDARVRFDPRINDDPAIIEVWL